MKLTTTKISILTFLSFIIISNSLKLPLQSLSLNNEIKASTNSNLRYLNTTNFHSYDDLYLTMSIPLCVGIPKQCFNLVYDTGEMYLILSNTANTAKFTKAFNMSASETSNSNTNNYIALNYQNGQLQLREVSDYVFIIEERPLYIFNFLLTWNTSIQYNFEGILGLGYLYPERDQGNSFDNRFSFMEYLKINKYIKKKVFGHEYRNRTHGSFYIDEIPVSMSENNYFKCKVEGFIPYLNKWHCQLRSLSFSTGENFTQIDAKSSVAFSTGYTDIRGPYIDGLIIFDTVIQYSNNKCIIQEYDMDKERYSKIICDSSLDISSIPDIYFNIKGYQLTLLKDDMFRLVKINGETKYIFKVIIDTRYNYWNLGEPILKNYNMVFDYEDKSVGFQENVNLIGESWFMTIVLTCLLFSICCFGIWIYKNRRRLFIKDIKDEDIDKIKRNEAFNEGKEMDSNYESFED